MKIKTGLLLSAALAASATFAQGGREAFLLQQTQAELQRVSGQMDVLQSNFDELQRRLQRLEGGGDARGLRQEVESLKAAVAELRNELRRQRGEIVQDLSGRIAKMRPPAPPPQPRTVTRTVVVPPHIEYTVQDGDTLSLIAKAFNTSVSKIRELNGFKRDTLRVGQKIKVPKE